MIEAIQTAYKNYKFRSKLEAQWAVFFDKLGIEFRYEVEGFELSGSYRMRYLPDFFLPKYNCWVEIKPTLPTKEEREKAIRLCTGLQTSVIMLCGDAWHDCTGFGFHYLGTSHKPKSKSDISPEVFKNTIWISATECIAIIDKEDIAGCFVGMDYTLDYEWSPVYIAECSKCHAIEFWGVIPQASCKCDESACNSESPHLIAAYTAARQARFGR